MSKKRYATAKNPLVAAIIGGHFSFVDKDDAAGRLAEITQNFILSKQQPEGADSDTIVLWIKGFDVTKEESKKGFTGNYALVNVEETPDKKFTLSATKLDSELRYHPQRKRETHSHPNWGHPILRAVKRQKRYDTVEAVQAELQQLHEEYPQTTIPGPNKLFIMIYSREGGKGSRVQKYVLEIKLTEGNKYYIECEENNYQPPEEKPAETDAEMPKGYFTSMVALKRNKKR